MTNFDAISTIDKQTDVNIAKLALALDIDAARDARDASSPLPNYDWQHNGKTVPQSPSFAVVAI
jgi:hypothetical protein